MHTYSCPILVSCPACWLNVLKSAGVRGNVWTVFHAVHLRKQLISTLFPALSSLCSVFNDLQHETPVVWRTLLPEAPFVSLYHTWLSVLYFRSCHYLYFTPPPPLTPQLHYLSLLHHSFRLQPLFLPLLPPENTTTTTTSPPSSHSPPSLPESIGTTTTFTTIISGSPSLSLASLPPPLVGPPYDILLVLHQGHHCQQWHYHSASTDSMLYM